MRKLLFTACALMLGIGVMSANLHGQDAPDKAPAKEKVEEAEAVKPVVYKAGISGMM